MIGADRAALAGLIALAGFLWSRDGASADADLWTALAGFPLFMWLGWPWRLHAGGPGVAPAGVGAGGALIAVGLFLDSGLALAGGWTALAGAWLAARLDDRTARQRALARLPLLLFAFPWLARDGQMLGWWFRISGAWATERAFALTGLDVTRDGVFLVVQHLHVSVDAPCAGLNFLQSLLLAGLTLAAWRGRLERPADWIRVLPLLIGLAWLANTVRIIVLCAVALTFGAPAAKGAFHEWGGLGVLVAMFLLCQACFARPRPSAATS